MLYKPLIKNALDQGYLKTLLYIFCCLDKESKKGYEKSVGRVYENTYN